MTEAKTYTTRDLRNDILDMVDWSIEDGIDWAEVYGVISSIEKFVELCYKASLMAEQTKGESDETKTN